MNRVGVSQLLNEVFVEAFERAAVYEVHGILSCRSFEQEQYKAARKSGLMRRCVVVVARGAVAVIIVPWQLA